MSSHANRGIKIEFHGSLNLPVSDEFIKQMGLQEFGPVQKVVDSECIRLMEEYMPRRNGLLIKDLILSNAGRIGSGVIVENSPHAHYLYEGIVYIDPVLKCAGFIPTTGPYAGQWLSRKNVTKVPSNRQLEYAGAPKRGKKWFKRMAADHKEDILKKAQEAANREVIRNR